MKIKNLALISVVALFLVAILLRFYEFEGFVTFLGDQGRDATIVKRIVTLEHFPAIGAPSSVGQVYLGPFYYYLIAPFLLLFNYNPVGLAVAVALLSLVGTILAWYVVRKEVNLVVSIVFLGLLSFSAVLIELSRFSWNPNLLPFFSFFTLYTCYKWLKTQDKRWGLAFGSLLAFSIQLHYLGLLLMPALGLAFLYALYVTKDKLKLVLQTLYPAAALLLFSVPLILFDLRHGFLNSKNFIKLFTEGNVIENTSYFTRLGDTSQGFIRHALQLELEPMLAMVVIFAFALLTYAIYTKTRSKLLLFLGGSVVLYILGFALLQSPRHIHYFGPAYVGFYLILSSALMFMKDKTMQRALGVLILSGFALLQLPKYYFFTQAPNHQIRHAREIAKTFNSRITKQPIQMVPIPTTETDGHYRYFLEIDGYKILANDVPDQAEELYVLCFNETQEPCKPLDDPQWQIAAFYDKQMAASWQAKGVRIYKIIHGKTN
ncbi:MAG: ArnT family glycosyltransferase [Weeksellaceae bacterium]